MLGGQPADQILLRSYDQGGPRRRLLDNPDDVAGGARLIGHGNDFSRALGVYDYSCLRIPLACFADLLHREAGVHSAVSLPHHHPAIPQAGLLVRRPFRIPDSYLLRCEPQGQSGIAPQMFVWEKQNVAFLPECPPEYGTGVGGGTDSAPQLATKSLKLGAGVLIRDGNDVRR